MLPMVPVRKDAVSHSADDQIVSSNEIPTLVSFRQGC